MELTSAQKWAEISTVVEIVSYEEVCASCPASVYCGTRGEELEALQAMGIEPLAPEEQSACQRLHKYL